MNRGAQDLLIENMDLRNAKRHLVEAVRKTRTEIQGQIEFAVRCGNEDEENALRLALSILDKHTGGLV